MQLSVVRGVDNNDNDDDDVLWCRVTFHAYQSLIKRLITQLLCLLNEQHSVRVISPPRDVATCWLTDSFDG